MAGAISLARLLQRRFAILASRQLGRNIERLFGFLILGLLRSSYQFLHFELQLRNHLARPRVAHRGMLAGVGLELGAIDADRAQARTPKHGQSPARELVVATARRFLGMINLLCRGGW